jgi:hypothetical protein
LKSKDAFACIKNLGKVRQNPYFDYLKMYLMKNSASNENFTGNHTPFVMSTNRPCPLTGMPRTLYQEGSRMTFFYDTSETGRVWYDDSASMTFPCLNNAQKQALAEFCKKNEEPVLINREFIKEFFPEHFREN